MTDVITTIEDALVVKTIATVVDSESNSLLKKCDHLPGEMTIELLKKISNRSPSVYWSFLGGREKGNENNVYLNSSWMMYVVTTHPSGDEGRRRGDKRQIGAYQILSALIPVINNFTIPDVGSFRFKQARNLYSALLEKNHVALYVATFELPMTFSLTEDSTLDNFETFHVDYDLPTHETLAEHNKWLLEPADHTTSKPDASDDVKPEQ